MKKKITHSVLFVAVLAGTTALTLFAGRGNLSSTIYNFVFLAVIAVLYLIAMFGGMFRMNNLSTAFHRAVEELNGMFKTPGKTDPRNLTYLGELFDDKYLDQKMDSFTDSINNSKEGLGDIEEFINEDELDIHVHKKLLEMVPDIFTSLGILGTFLGLVWGLRDFQPTDYSAMTSSVEALVEGIKVAFLTSIYGISFSIIYTFGMKGEYSSMTEELQGFLEKFHSYVMPTAENESRNLLLASQKLQTSAMKQMAEQFSVQMADSFEKVITPTFQKMNDSLDMLVSSVTRCQEDAIREISDEFLKQMNNSFHMQFRDFNVALDQLKKAQKENTAYTSAMYQTMSQKLSETYDKQDKAITDMVREMGGMQTRYMSTANRILSENQEIQKMQQQDYQHIVDYLKDAEKSAAKFWVACNQAMQKYVETAASSIERVGATGQASAELIQANSKMAEQFTAQMEDFAQYQRLSYKTMEQVRKLLSEVTAANTRDVSLIASGRNDSVEKLGNLIAQQNEGQQALLEEINKNMKELSKAAQKGKFGLFR